MSFFDVITHSAASNATMVDSDGLLKWRPHNLALNSATPATQSITVVSGADYTVECTGVSIALSGAGTGTVTEGNPVTITASTTTLTLTVTGSTGTMWAYRSDLGGMVNNPDRGDSYVPTTSSAVYLPRRGHHVYNGDSWVNKGLLHESEARTNLVTYSSEFDNAYWTHDNISVASSQADPSGNFDAFKIIPQAGTAIARLYSENITVGTTSTTSIYAKADGFDWIYVKAVNSGGGVWFNVSTGDVGTENSGFSGRIESVGSGFWRCSVSTATETAERHRIYVCNSDNTENATASGSDGVIIYGAQAEAGSTPSSYIPTSGATVTRSAETLTVPAANLPWSSDAVSIQMQGEMTYADTNAFNEVVFALWQSNVNNYISLNIDTNSTRQGSVDFLQLGAGALSRVESDYFTPGVNVPFNIASRHGSTFINGAVDGVALTANTTPTALPDLSATDLQLGFDYMGTISLFRVWADDLTDAGIAEASAPSTVPSLSLTFDGASTSFTDTGMTV